MDDDGNQRGGCRLNFYVRGIQRDLFVVLLLRPDMGELTIVGLHLRRIGKFGIQQRKRFHHIFLRSAHQVVAAALSMEQNIARE